MLKERERLRKEGKYDDADAIRNKLLDRFKISIEDSEFGTIWYRS